MKIINYYLIKIKITIEDKIEKILNNYIKYLNNRIIIKNY